MAVGLVNGAVLLMVDVDKERYPKLIPLTVPRNTPITGDLFPLTLLKIPPVQQRKLRESFYFLFGIYHRAGFLTQPSNNNPVCCYTWICCFFSYLRSSLSFGAHKLSKSAVRCCFCMSIIWYSSCRSCWMIEAVSLTALWWPMYRTWQLAGKRLSIWGSRFLLEVILVLLT